ncbi:hypothetical protein WKW79_29285 [Variovorax robiniae]|uniref:Uncharacterized protein n=1 Tax=Variovorax robiniae TaxID=1836199 RepID=A0ABU8XGG1_9BURK
MQKVEIDRHFLLEIWFVALVSVVLGIGLIVGAHQLTPPQISVIVHDVVLSQPQPDPFLKVFLKELGFALIIAGLLAVTFEYLTKSKHQEAADRLVAKINVDLFHAVLGRDIPPSLYAHLKKCALSADIFRTGFRVFFTLGTAGPDRDNPDESKYIRLSEETQYRIRNISNVVQNFRLTMYLDPVKFPAKDNVPQPEFRFIKVDGVDIPFEGGKVIASDLEVNAYYAVELSPGEEKTIDSSSYCYLRLTDEQVFTMRDPTETLSVTLISHSPVLNLDCIALHSSDLVEIRKEPTSKEWLLNDALVGGQGVIVKWSKIEDLN